MKVKLKCPHCATINIVRDIVLIKNSCQAFPFKCTKCDTGFHKDNIVFHAKKKAIKIIGYALYKMQKHIPEK